MPGVVRAAVVASGGSRPDRLGGSRGGGDCVRSAAFRVPAAPSVDGAVDSGVAPLAGAALLGVVRGSGQPLCGSLWGGLGGSGVALWTFLSHAYFYKCMCVCSLLFFVSVIHVMDPSAHPGRATRQGF